MTNAIQSLVFLLAHGSWHNPNMYDPLKQALAAQDYSLITPSLPTMALDAPANQTSWDADAATLVEAAEPYFEQGIEVVLIGHSYGGIPATVATRGQGVDERKAAGLTGGFRHIVFLCAFALEQEGISLIDALGGEPLSWQTLDYDTNESFVTDEAKDVLYNGLSAETAQEYFDELVPQSLTAATEPVDFAVPDITIGKTYIITENDLAFLPSLQQQTVDDLGLASVSVSGGHSSYASVPDEVANALIQIALGS
ncbi:alpha/beta-hydrolase [Xylariaceae sp. FL1272]|nr:alpha/beta-hydrolase [Xylariaceae sp. FL1272]